jgi:hypothetical protein
VDVQMGWLYCFPSTEFLAHLGREFSTTRGNVHLYRYYVVIPRFYTKPGITPRCGAKTVNRGCSGMVSGREQN